MSLNPSLVPILSSGAQLQTLSARPIGLHSYPTQPPGTLPVLVNWSDYINTVQVGQGIGLTLDISALSQQQYIDKIRSIKIDNTYNGMTVYVVFPDTGDTVICAPYSAVVAPVYTNALSAVIYGTGIYFRRGPRTLIEFCNFDRQGLVMPSSDPNGVQITTGGSISFSSPGQAFSGVLTTNSIPAADRTICCFGIIVGAAVGAVVPQSFVIGGVATTLSFINLTPDALGGNSAALTIMYGRVPAGADPLPFTMTMNAPNTALDSVQIMSFVVNDTTQLAPVIQGFKTRTSAGSLATVVQNLSPGMRTIVWATLFEGVTASAVDLQGDSDFTQYSTMFNGANTLHPFSVAVKTTLTLASQVGASARTPNAHAIVAQSWF